MSWSKSPCIHPKYMYLAHTALVCVLSMKGRGVYEDWLRVHVQRPNASTAQAAQLAAKRWGGTHHSKAPIGNPFHSRPPVHSYNRYASH